MLIEKYNTLWPDQFQEIKEILSGAIKGLDVDIQHVGGTSVPGLASKPIIDIDLIYQKASDFEYIKYRLEAIGHYHKGDQGIAGREVFKKSKGDNTSNIPYHLYVCQSDSAELRRHLLFRDYLRTHKKERDFYQDLKQSIAAEAGQDRKVYADLKEQKAASFINYIINLSAAGNRSFV